MNYMQYCFLVIYPEPSANRHNGYHRAAPPVDNDEDHDSAMECDPSQFEDAED